MEKKIYDTPKIAMMEVETASMIASSIRYDEQSGTGAGTGSVDFSDAGNADRGNAGNARVASNQYFDSWDEE